MLVEFLRPALYIWALIFERTIGINEYQKYFAGKFYKSKWKNTRINI